jgi:hypothetical protein
MTPHTPAHPAKESPLSRIPPSEPSFKQHVQKGNKCLEPVLLTAMMSSDFLQDLICSCKCRYERATQIVN